MPNPDGVTFTFDERKAALQLLHIVHNHLVVNEIRSGAPRVDYMRAMNDVGACLRDMAYRLEAEVQRAGVTLQDEYQRNGLPKKKASAAVGKPGWRDEVDDEIKLIAANFHKTAEDPHEASGDGEAEVKSERDSD